MSKVTFTDIEIRQFMITNKKLLETSRFNMEYYRNGELVNISNKILDRTRTAKDVLVLLDNNINLTNLR